MKRLFLSTWLFSALYFPLLCAETISVSGDVYGTWSADSVLVTGEIRVPCDSTLLIDPGVKVLFQTNCKFIVDSNATLQAIGTATDTILFDEFYPDTSWGGIRIIYASDSCRLEYCHFTHGFAPDGVDDDGGAIFCENSSLTLEHCCFDSCTAMGSGGAVRTSQSNIVIHNSSFINNGCTHGGGAVYVYFGSLELLNCTFLYNSSSAGGGLYLAYLDHVTLTNCLIADNVASEGYTGGGIRSLHTQTLTMINCSICNNDGVGMQVGYAENVVICNNIFVGNTSYQLHIFSTSQLNVSYSNFEGGYAGTGNIDVDPLFVDPENGNYHLQSTAGSYHNGLWLTDQFDSPCIDAGDPTSSFDIEPLPHGYCVNLGTYGNTPEASKSAVVSAYSGPISGIWTVDASPHHILDEVWVADDQNLEIEAGCRIIFHANCSLEVLAGATFNACGLEEDTIVFLTSNQPWTWHGLRFFNASDSCKLQYCKIINASAQGEAIEAHGGGIFCDQSNLQIEHSLINNCWATGFGGGIYLQDSNPTIEHSKITGCTAEERGGAIYCTGSSPIIRFNLIEGNSTTNVGGGICCYNNSNPQIANNLILYNQAIKGAGLYLNGSNPVVVNNTILGNVAGNTGGALRCHDGADPIIKNCILWDNSPNQVSIGSNSAPLVTYSDVSGGWDGAGNKNFDPKFVDSLTGDFHLQSSLASYHQGEWLPDPCTSFCIDAGDPASPFELEPDPNGARVNMGAYGNTTEASLSASGSNMSGSVYGVWQKSYHPYKITGSVNIPADSSLIIEPGVNILFQGTFSFTVNSGATLKASGTEDLPIRFITADTVDVWAGIKFDHASDSCRLDYCYIEGGAAGGGWPDNCGGGILCLRSSPTLHGCTITNCTAEWSGGGIALLDSSGPIISQTVIRDNVCEYYGGGIFCINQSDAEFKNSLIHSNDGGGMNISFSSPVIENCVIADNSTASTAGGVRCIGLSLPIIRNSIIWNNAGMDVLIADGADIEITYSNIEDGWAGEGNIASVPQFSAGPLSDYQLAISSPCVDTGNPEPSFNDQEDPANPGYALWPSQETVRNDMGAYGGGGAAGWVGMPEEPTTPVLPKSFALHAPYPNPFNPSTVISYELRVASYANVLVFNVEGRQVKELVDGWRDSGPHTIPLDASNLASGIYFVRLQAGKFQQTQKLVLLK